MTTADWQDNPVGTRHDVSEIKRTRHKACRVLGFIYYKNVISLYVFLSLPPVNPILLLYFVSDFQFAFLLIYKLIYLLHKKVDWQTIAE